MYSLITFHFIYTDTFLVFNKLSEKNKIRNLVLIYKLYQKSQILINQDKPQV